MTHSLKDLYIDQLRDLYSAEHQIVKALPKIAKHASSRELRSALEEHLQQTKGQVERLEEVFASLGEKAREKKCAGMEGLIKEGAQTMQEDYGDGAMDAALIAEAQRVEHYEIAAYGTVCTFAELLGHTDQAALLRETLQEEKQADQILTDLSRNINQEALQAVSAGGRHEHDVRKTRRAA